MGSPSSFHSLTRRTLTLRRIPSRPEISFKSVGSILGTPSQPQVNLKRFDNVSPEHCAPETHVAIQHLLDTSIPRWRRVSSPIAKLVKPSRIHIRRRAWTRLRKRQVGPGQDIIIMVERETVDAVPERLLSPVSLEQRLRRVEGPSRWKRSKTWIQMLWKRPLSADVGFSDRYESSVAC